MSPGRAPEGRLALLIELADAVRDLTTSQVNAAKFVLQDDRGRAKKNDVHYTRHPSLLDQLRAAGTAGRGGDAAMTGGYESRPAARLEALDVLHSIERSTDDWLVRRFGVDARPTVEENLRALVGLASAADDQVQKDVTESALAWLTWARVVTGWDSPPWRPNAGCPACEEVGTLRVRLEERVAACLQCREAWTPGTIGILADHLREVNADARTRRQQAARMRAELDGFFPYRGPCLACAHPRDEPADARHRLIDAVVDLVLADMAPADVAHDFDLPAEAVHVAVAVATWPAEDAEPVSAAG